MRGTLPWMAPELFPGVRQQQRQQEAAAGSAVAGGGTYNGSCDDRVSSNDCMKGGAATTTADVNVHVNGVVDYQDDRVNEKVRPPRSRRV